jgi:hypothetical protein
MKILEVEDGRLTMRNNEVQCAARRKRAGFDGFAVPA